MTLQSKYRNERDGILTYEDENLYFAYQFTDNEAHVLEVYIREDLRGNCNFYYDFIKNFLLNQKEISIKYIVGYVFPKTIGAERSLQSLIKFGFKLLKTDNEKIFLFLEI